MKHCPFDLSSFGPTDQDAIRRFIGRLDNDGIHSLLARNAASFSNESNGQVVMMRPSREVRMIGRLASQMSKEDILLHSHAIYGGVMIAEILTHQAYNKYDLSRVPTTPFKVMDRWIPEPYPGTVLDRTAAAILDRDIGIVRRLLNDGRLNERLPRVSRKGETYRFVERDEVLEDLASKCRAL